MQVEKYKIDQFNQDNLQQHKSKVENASSEIKNVVFGCTSHFR